jgi:hypothetical protein
MDTAALADDIADLALDAARAATTPQDNTYSYVVRVVADRSVLAGVDVYRLLEAQLSRLVSRIEEYTPSEAETPDETEAHLRGPVPPVGVTPAAGVAAQALESASQFLASDYRITSPAS